MCEAFTIAAATVAVAGAIYGAKKQQEEGEYEQKVLDQNAKGQEDQASLALQRGAIQVGVQRMKAGQERGVARAALGGSGADMQTGAPLDVISDASMMGELDAQTIGNNAAREAWGYSVQAASDRAGGQAAARRGRSAAYGTLLGGAAQALSIGSAYKASIPKGSTTGNALQG